MTTVAFCNDVLAADSLATQGDTRCAEVDKIHRLKGGRVAFIGSYGACFGLLRWLEDGRRGDQPAAEGGAIIFVPNEGAPSIFENGYEEPIGRAPFHAWGSGAQFALGAMAMGATAGKAVETAAQFDLGTGGALLVMAKEPG